MEDDKNKSTTADMDEGQDTQSAKVAVTVQAEPLHSRPMHICKALGPFDKFAAAETVSDQLVRMGLIPLLRSVDKQVIDDYWVYLPGKGRQYSAEVIQRLKGNNITDYYVFDSENYLVSLGTFKRIGLAETQQAMLQQMGINALIEPRYKSRVEHWLEMYAEEKYDERLEILAMETPGLQIKAEFCMSFALR